MAPTIFPLGPNARNVYVSSVGDDKASGITPTTSVLTLAAAFRLSRTGRGDHILMRCGDTFVGPVPSVPSGASAAFPTVVGSFGTGAKPVITVDAGQGVMFQGNVRNDFVALQGWTLTYPRRDPASALFTDAAAKSDSFGVRVNGQGSMSILLEDFEVRHATDCLQFFGVSGLTLRRCVLSDNWSTTGKSQGAYLDKCDGVLVEGCNLTHNGWSEVAAKTYPGAAASILSHGLYIQTTCGPDITVRNNVFTLASSHGAQLRTGGVLTGNLFDRCALAALVATNKSIVSGNVIMTGRDISPKDLRRAGIEIIDVPDVEVTGNFALNQAAGPYPMYAFRATYNTSKPTRFVFDGNITAGWNGPDVDCSGAAGFRLPS